MKHAVISSMSRMRKKENKNRAREKVLNWWARVVLFYRYGRGCSLVKFSLKNSILNSISQHTRCKTFKRCSRLLNLTGYANYLNSIENYVNSR